MSQESRVSSTQDSFRLSVESRSGVSALVSVLNYSANGVDQSTDNEKLRGDSTKVKDRKLQDPFPWMTGFCNLCQAAVGSRNVRHLENLLNVYLEYVTPNVKDCYTKPIRAAKLKKYMKYTLIFFHLFYQEIKETLEHSFYLEKMTPLVSMYMDMEIKASRGCKESEKKVASRLTSSLYIFLDNSEEHMLDAILMTRFVLKNYRDICRPLLWKLLNNISVYPKYDMLYVRCLLTFKLLKKIVPDAEERKHINKTATKKLHTPPNLMENIKAMGNVLPRIPKTKKNITLFLMQSNFNLKNACQEFLKFVKKPQKGAYNQGLGVEIDKPLCFANHSGDSSPGLTEKEDESDSGSSNNLINDIWSSISTVESNVPQNKRLNDLTPEQPSVVDSQETPKKSKKVEKKKKKKGKKQKVVKGLGNKKKKKSTGSSEKSGKQTKKLGKLKGKKKKKKKILASGDHSQNKPKPVVSSQVEDRNKLKVTVPLTQVEECTPVIVQPNSPVIGELNPIRNIKAGHLISIDEESQQTQLKQASSNQEEKAVSKDNEAQPQIGESDQVVIQTQSKRFDKLVDQQLRFEETILSSGKKSSGHAEETDKVTSNQVSSMAEECGIRKAKSSEVKSGVRKGCLASVMSEELKTTKSTQFINKLDDKSQIKAKTAVLQHDECSQGKVAQASPHVDEFSQGKIKPASPQLDEPNVFKSLQAFLNGDNNLLKVKPLMLLIEEYGDNEVQNAMEQLRASDRRRISQLMNQFTECDEKLREAKIEPQLEIPKTEKYDCPPSGHTQESELLGTSVETLEVKLEIVGNDCTESQDLLMESVFTNYKLNDKCGQDPDKIVPVIMDEVKSIESSQKSQTLENPDPGHSVAKSSQPPLTQKVCSSSETTEPEDLDMNKTLQIESDSDAGIVDESKPQEVEKWKEAASKEDIVLSDDGDSLPQQATSDNNSATGNGEICIKTLGFSEVQTQMRSNIFPVESMESETDNPSVNADLEPEPPTNISGNRNNIHNSMHEKTLHDYPSSPSSYGTEDWLPDVQNSLIYYELERPELPICWMEGDMEIDMSSTSSAAPERGLGKMSHSDVMPYNPQKELCASASGRHNSQGCLMMNSSGSGHRENSPLLTSSPMGSSSNSESAIETMYDVAKSCKTSFNQKICHISGNAVHEEVVAEESMDTCDNLMETSDLIISRYDTSNSSKYSSASSSPIDVSYNHESSSPCKIGSRHMDNARVVVEAMDIPPAISSKSEVSLRKNTIEASSQHSPQKRKKSSKLLPEQTVDSHSSTGKHETGEAGNIAAQSRDTSRGMLSVLMGAELGGNGKSSQYESTPAVTSTVPSAQYVQGSFISASQTSNIPTSAYPSISTTIGLGAGTALPPISDLWRCSCAECSVGSVNFGSSNLSKNNYNWVEKAYSQSEKGYNLVDKNYNVSDKAYSASDKTYSASDKTYSASEKTYGLSDKNDLDASKNCNADDKCYLSGKTYGANEDNFNSINKSCNQNEKSCVETEKSCVIESDMSVSENKQNINESSFCLNDKNYIANTYSYFGKVPELQVQETARKTQNEKLLQKIEQSFSAPTYDFNSDSSLPLKKRLKLAKMSYEPTGDSTVIDPLPKTKLESFPSYPAAPMISIADIDFSNNDFLKKWNSLYLTNKTSKSVIVDNRVCNMPAHLQNSYINNQNASHAISSTNYDDTLVKNLQHNLYAHCGQCAEEAVNSVCDSALYGSSTSIGQVNPSSNDVPMCSTSSAYSCPSSLANYSATSLSCTPSSIPMSSSSSPLYNCSSSYDCKASSSCSPKPSPSFSCASISSTNASSPSAYKVNSSGYSAQHTQGSQYYQIPNSAYYKGQSSSHSMNAKHELYKCDNKSGDVTSVKVNQSGSRCPQDRRKEVSNTNFTEKVTFDPPGQVENVSHRLDRRHAPQNSRLRHHEVEKQVQPNYGEDEDDEDEEEDDDEDDKREAADGDGEEEDDDEDEDEDDDDEDEDEAANRKEAPLYTIVQKASDKISSTDSKKETTRIMPFRIFLNKNKIHKELAKNSCAHCKMVDCKGDCPKPSSSNAVDESNPTSDTETNDDSSSDARFHRRRGRKPKPNKDGDETVRKSKRIGGKKCGVEYTDFVVNYDKKRRKKNVSR